MPSRNIADCTPFLQEVWAYGSSEFKRLHPNLPQPFLTCTYRSNQEQEKLYAKGRTKPGKIVTYSKPGTSKHNIKPARAFDIAFKQGSKLFWTSDLFAKFYAIVRAKYPRVGWGGNFSFKDFPHFEE